MHYKVHFYLFSEVRGVTSCQQSTAHFEISPGDWRLNDGPSKMTFSLMHLRNKQKKKVTFKIKLEQIIIL